MRTGRRRRKLSTENVATSALVFRFAGSFDTVVMELRVVDGKQLILVDCRADVGGHNGPVMIEIKNPDGAGGQQENDERGELFLLFHAAVLK
jgi:hypothetical protein